MPFAALTNSPPHRIMIIGSSGSGKSTLAQALAKTLSVPVSHMDHLYWKPGWTPRSQSEIVKRVATAAALDIWIIEGNHSKTFPLRASRATTLIWLDVPRWRCILRGIRRTLRNYGQGRPDLPEGCPDRFSWKLLGWQWRYPRKGRKKALALLKETESDLEQVILRTPQDVEMFLTSLRPQQTQAKDTPHDPDQPMPRVAKG